MATKAEFRRIALEARARIGDPERERASGTITGHLMRWEVYEAAETVLIYRSFGKEISTDRLLEDAWRRRKTVGVPRMASERLETAIVGPNTPFAPGRFGILEPRESVEHPPLRWDLIVVPGVAFDRHGHRLGDGRGFFDRFLARRMHRATVGLTYDELLVDAVPHDDYDVRLDWLVTPSGLLATQA